MDVNITGSIVILVIVWWLVFLPMLSRGVTGVWEDEAEHAEGVDQGAPVDPQIGKKAWRTTLIAVPVALVIILFIHFGPHLYGG